MRRLPLLLVSSVFCALLSLGCKQDVGERCEQNSDCSSGICEGMSFTSSMGGTCKSMRGGGGPTDAARTDAPTIGDTGTGSDAADAADDAPDVSPASDATSDAPPADVGAADGASLD